MSPHTPRAVGNHKDAGWRFPKGATKGHSGEVSNIFFNQIKCTSENGIFVGETLRRKCIISILMK